MTSTARRQAGITVIGFLLLASLLGAVGLAGIKLVPLYITNMKLSKVLEDVQRELAGSGPTPQTIRRAIDNRFAVEDIDLPKDAVKISQSRNGFQVQIQHENRVPYIADVWLMVVFDKQVEIAR